MPPTPEPAPPKSAVRPTSLRDPRIWLAAALTLFFCVWFWVGSRYPSLNEKALSGGDMVLDDPLAFDPVVVVDSDAPVAERIWATTLNWLSVNRQGMTFGILIGAALMSLIALLQGRLAAGRFRSALLGTVIGAPLGVCVNCAAPIAQGLRAAGSTLELALAAMVSSPTLNVVILSMLLALFPSEVVVLKLGVTLAFLLFGIPLLSRFVFGDASLSDPSLATTVPHLRPRMEGESALPGEVTGWLASIVWVVSAFLRNLGFLVVRTVPLMFLAGALGAVMVTFVPWETFVRALPDPLSPAGIATLAGTAALGIFLPVPIAFDMVVCATLLAAGVPLAYVTALLFTLGSYSIYSFFVVWRASTMRVAASMAVALGVLGLATGIGAGEWGELVAQRRLDQMVEELERLAATLPPVEPSAPGLPAVAAGPTAAVAAPAAPLAWQPFGRREGVAIARASLAPAQAGAGTLFARETASSLGLAHLPSATATELVFPPHSHGVGIAAGDVDGDGLDDLLVGGWTGPRLHRNAGGAGFTPVPLGLGPLAGRETPTVALLDLDGDADLDLLLGTYGEGNHWLRNEGGRFPGPPEALPGARWLAHAVAAGDLDRDGRLDVVLGNWTGGPWTRGSHELSRDTVVWNRPGGFEASALPAAPGETLALLLSDLDDDGDLDLWVGNDFRPRDVLYLGDGAGGLEPSPPASGFVVRSAFSTMSVDSADLDNDGDLEIYVGQIARGQPGDARKLDYVQAAEACDDFLEPAWRERCAAREATRAAASASFRERSPDACFRLADDAERGDCLALQLLLRAARWERDPTLCRRIPGRWRTFATNCRLAFDVEPVNERPWRDRTLPAVFAYNLLLERGPEGFRDVARERGAAVSGWTWNARFADYDLDGAQDLMVANGRYMADRWESNYFFRNDGRGGLVDATREAGARNHVATGAFAAIDLENDGDLDVVSVPQDGPLQVLRNGAGRGGRLVIELLDERGNRLGIGSRVTVVHGPEGTRQTREIKAGGGYLSQEAPRAYFGLGGDAAASAIEVRWSTGETTRIDGPFPVGHRYRLHREALRTAAVR